MHEESIGMSAMRTVALAALMGGGLAGGWGLGGELKHYLLGLLGTVGFFVILEIISIHVCLAEIRDILREGKGK